jgi:SOS-response transcriptional repressor LexA
LQFEKGELARLATEERYQRDLSRTRERYKRNLWMEASDEPGVHFPSPKPLAGAQERRNRLLGDDELLSNEIDFCRDEPQQEGRASPNAWENLCESSEAMPEPASYPKHAPPAPEQHDVPVLSRKQVARKVFSRRRAIRREVTSFVRSWLDRSEEGLYALTVWDDSMVPKFERGDRVIVNPKAPLKTSDFVVCCTTRKETLVRKMTLKDELIILEPLNPSFASTVVKKQEVKFAHRIVEVLFRE